MAPENPDVSSAPAQEPAAKGASISPGVLVTGAIVWIAIFVLIAGTEWLAVNKAVPETMMFAAAAIAATVGALLFTRIMIFEDARVLEEQARHRDVLQRLKMVADLNHHVRNALETIEWSAYTTRDQELINNVHSSVERIHRALHELVPAPDDKSQDQDDARSQRTGHG